MINKENSFDYSEIIKDHHESKDHVISIYKLINLHIFLKEIDFLHYEKLFISTKINTCKELFAQNLNDFAGIKILEEEKEILKKKIHDEEILVLFKAADKISAKTGTGLLTCIGKGKKLLECITREIKVTDSDCISYNEKMRNYGEEIYDLIKEDHINAHGEIITEEDNKARNKIRAEFQDSEIKFYDDKYNLVQTYNKYKNIEDANTAVYDTANLLDTDFRVGPSLYEIDLKNDLKYAYEYSRDLDAMRGAVDAAAAHNSYTVVVGRIAPIVATITSNPDDRDFGPDDTDDYEALGKLTKKLKGLKEARGNDDTAKPLLRAAKDSVTAAAIIVKKSLGLLLDTDPAKALKAAVTRAQNLKRELRRVNSSVTDDFTYPGFLQYNMEKVTTIKELFKKNINKNCLEYEYCNYIKLKFWNKSGKSGNHETYYHENCKKLIDGINFYMVLYAVDLLDYIDPLYTLEIYDIKELSENKEEWFQKLHIPEDGQIEKIKKLHELEKILDILKLPYVSLPLLILIGIMTKDGLYNMTYKDLVDSEIPKVGFQNAIYVYSNIQLAKICEKAGITEPDIEKILRIQKDNGGLDYNSIGENDTKNNVLKYVADEELSELPLNLKSLLDDANEEFNAQLAAV